MFNSCYKMAAFFPTISFSSQHLKKLMHIFTCFTYFRTIPILASPHCFVVCSKGPLDCTSGPDGIGIAEYQPQNITTSKTNTNIKEQVQIHTKRNIATDLQLLWLWRASLPLVGFCLGEAFCIQLAEQ